MHAGEEAFTGPQNDRDDGEDQLIDGVSGECLLDDRSAAGYIDVTATISTHSSNARIRI